jgi:hypothetical protein
MARDHPWSIQAPPHHRIMNDIALALPIISPEPEILSMRLKNRDKPINNLPPELLSRIFAVGDDEERGKRQQGLPYFGFQDLAVVSRAIYNCCVIMNLF